VTDFCLDWSREARTGLHEAVLCAPKTGDQIQAICAHAMQARQRLLLTRLSPRKFEGLSDATRSALDYEPVSRTAMLGGAHPPRGTGRVIIVAGGTSDARVAREAARTLEFAGETASLVIDVGVAGMWRLMERLDDIRTHRVVIAVAGMEGAIFSVLGGLVPGVVIAVPTSVGYGVASRGKVALHAALASCASGLVVVNIDNGFGAAHAALRILGREPSPPGG
jgi:NCAIR mutase (PurE)-related protein